MYLIGLTLTSILVLDSVVLMVSLVCIIYREQTDPFSPNSQQTCTMAGERTLFNMDVLDFDLDFEFSALNGKPCLHINT